LKNGSLRTKDCFLKKEVGGGGNKTGEGRNRKKPSESNLKQSRVFGRPPPASPGPVRSRPAQGRTREEKGRNGLGGEGKVCDPSISPPEQGKALETYQKACA